MTLTVPNIETPPTFDAQSVVDATDIAALEAGLTATGVVSGCGVTAQASPNMTVIVAAGTVLVAGTSYAVGSVASLSIAAASGSDRRDIVVYTVGTGVQVITGSPCGTQGWTRSSANLPPVKPAIPASSVLLGEVYVASTTTTIPAGNLVDKSVPTGTYVPAGADSTLTGHLTVGPAAGELIVNLAGSDSRPQAVYGAATLTGLAVNNQNAPIHLIAGDTTDNAATDYNVGLVVEQFTRHGAGISVINHGDGDGIYCGTYDTVNTWGTANCINIVQGDATHQTAIGQAINIQRYGTGISINVQSEAGSGTANPVIQVAQSVNGVSLSLQDTGTTTGHTVDITVQAKTSGPIINIFQGTTAMSGAVIMANVATGFTGQFLNCQVNGGTVTYLDSVGRLNAAYGIQPGAYGTAQFANVISQGVGVPSNAVGANGDSYFRTDTPGTPNERWYVKSAGAWVGIL